MKIRALLLLAFSACPGGDSAPTVESSSTSTGTTTSSSTTGARHGSDGLDSSGEPEPCSDDDVAPIDISIDDPEVTISDLVVCGSDPTDRFELDAECDGYLSVEIRSPNSALEDVPDLVLLEGGQPVDHAFGSWERFFLKPIHRHITAGHHEIEVQHSGGGPQWYSLTIIMMPDPTCWP